MKRIIAVFLLFGVVLSVNALTVEEIFEEETSTLKKYSFSNDLKEIQNEIDTKINKNMDLNNIAWRLVKDDPTPFFDHIMPQNVKNAMNRLNVNYSLNIIITGYQSTIIVYRRVDTQWFYFSA